ncbi:hypothetical protein [Micromonospora sp. CB01531]|uniref:hypothetical protein n=1 Tax=Micromonospora sp. CB01531 TaxID=1718947 RepID=UPI00093A7306|nr:hypothetical protein [Micromonospora sp. CB01531]OKI49347.1 hypothetical protein A6A27_35010 [Micromonospora sp. CB01531]
MARIKWFVPASADDPYNPFGVADYGATLYGRHDGFTMATSTGADPQEVAAANRAIWEAQPAPMPPGPLARLLHRHRTSR